MPTHHFARRAVAAKVATADVAVRSLARAVADVPFEYCEWYPEFKKCKAWFQENWQEAYPDVKEEGLIELMTKLGFEGTPDSNAKKAQVTCARGRPG